MTTAVEPVRKVESLYIQKEIIIAAPVAIVFETLFEPVGPMAQMQMKIEPFVGGRWFRDLGNGAGHLWGHVQVIKPPTLLELTGPMFMSYPAISHVQYRLTEDGKNTKLVMTHQAMGLLMAEHMTGVHDGWSQILAEVKKKCEEKSTKA